MMQAADFLFPRELEVTPTNLNKVLFVGSCLSEAFVRHFRKSHSNIHFDHTLFNYVSDLPKRSEDDLRSYDVQYIQLPLRSVLTDAVIRIADNNKRSDPIDWLRLGKQNLELMLEAALAYSRQAGILTLVSTFFCPQRDVVAALSERRTVADISWVVAQLNDHLAALIRPHKNVFLADVEMIAQSIGKRFFLDDFINFHSHGSVHYSDWAEHNRIEAVPRWVDIYENRLDEFFDAVFRQLETLVRSARQIDQVKLVIFDLDDTMWRGQLVEHYKPGERWPHNLGFPLGIWEAVQHLRWRGILTSIASKNDYDVVAARWKDIVQPPFAQFGDFVHPQITFGSKTESIAKIMSAFGLTAKSTVFVDDHPVEREAATTAFTGLRAIGANPYVTRRILLWSAETNPPFRTDETKRREDMIRQQVDRETERAKFSKDEFRQTLETKLTAWNVQNSEHQSFSRIVELVNKTNQFNTTGKRWEVADYQDFWKRDGRVFAFSIKDRFADYGTVGVVFALGSQILQFVMSCRVLGMDVEIAMLKLVIDDVRSVANESISAPMIVTDSNMPCRDLYTRAGFLSDGADFILPNTTSIVSPEHVAVQFSAGP